MAGATVRKNGQGGSGAQQPIITPKKKQIPRAVSGQGFADSKMIKFGGYNVQNSTSSLSFAKTQKIEMALNKD